MNSEHFNTENRKHKDSLFVDYFSKDRDWKQHFLSLYNALHGTDLQVETTRLERVNLEQVLYMDYYNDIAVMVDDQFIMMIEHQSTINPNMPLRLLEYVTRIYGNMIDSKSKFSNQLIPLAKPEFIVFYTGKENIPPESYLSLSDAFKLNHVPNSELTLELVVKVCKINGTNPSPVVHNCPDSEHAVRRWRTYRVFLWKTYIISSGVLRGRKPLSSAGGMGGFRRENPPLLSRGGVPS